MDYTALTTAIDFTSVLTAVSAIAVTLAGLYMAIKGAKIVLGFFKPNGADG